MYKRQLIDSVEHFDCNRTEILGDAQGDGPEPYALMGDYPVYEAMTDYMNPQSNTRITFRFCFPNCQENDRVKIRTDVYWEGVVSKAEYPSYPNTDSTCRYPDLTIDAETLARWGASTLGLPSYDVRYNKETKLVTTNPLGAYCTQCDCPTADSVG